MKRGTALIVLTLASIMGIWGQEAGATLFVTSNPIRAEVRLNGSLLPSRTPLLLRDLVPGEHRFEVEKDGYLFQKLKIEFASGEMRVLMFDLVEQGVSSVFPSEQRIFVMGQEEQARDNVFYFERGDYTITREQGEVYVDPLFPQQRLIDGLHIAIPIMLVFSSLLTVDAIFSPSDSSWPVPPAVLAANGITVSMIGVDIALNLKKRKQQQSYSYFTCTQEQTQQRARSLYSEAERLLESGSLSEAADRYTRLVDSSHDSPLLPQALYRMAGIHYLQGENESAVVLYRRIVQEYPVAEIYDKCQKTLADLLLQSNSYEESIRHLDGMVYFDPLYTPEAIAAYRCLILEDWAEVDPAARDKVNRCYEEFLEKYPDSEMIEIFRRKLGRE